MATLQATTASNWPKIARDSIEEVETIIAEYDFFGTHDSLTVGVSELDDENSEPHLNLYGYASFEASKPVTDQDGSVVDREHGYTEEFLERLAPHLEEQLVVETVGYEKCRFPLLAGQWVAWPDGTVTYNSFDHSPAQPDVDDADETDDAESEPPT